MLVANADFETYSEAGQHWDVAEQKWRAPPGQGSGKKRGLEHVGLRNYVWHPSFRPLSLCYRIRDNSVPYHRVRPVRLEFRDQFGIYEIPDDLRAHVERGGIVESWNVGFESEVWAWCAANWGWPALPLAQQRCTMSRSKAAAYPGRLEDAAHVLKLTEQKDDAGAALIRKLTVPRNPTKKDQRLRWTPESAPADFEAFYSYNEQDVNAECEASCVLPELTPHEFRVWTFDQTVNRRGMRLDVASIDNCIAVVEELTERLNGELQQITGGLVKAYTEVEATLRWLSTRGAYLSALDEETVGDTLKAYEKHGLDLKHDPVCRVLRIRQSLSFGSVKKLYSMRAKVGSDGRIRENYQYHGAHTGLWNGRDPQMANLPRPMHSRFENPDEVEKALRIIACRSVDLLEYEYPDLEPLEVIASCLRSLIIASDGCRLISADFSAIQAVVTACLAGEQWRIDVFRTHGKIYEAQAALLTGKSVDEYSAYKKASGHHHEDRQLGKLAVLSADFGAWVNGWKRFGADKLVGDDFAIKNLILRTRNAIPNIVELWGGQTRDRFSDAERPELFGLEGAVVSALLRPGQAYAYRGITYQMHGDTLYCQPPSGGFIRYHGAHLRPSQRPYAREWEYEIVYEGWNSNATKGAQGWQSMFLYGGVLTQNVVSHEAREVQALSLIRLEDNGYPIVMHTHDEGVADVPNGRGSRAEYERLVNILPEWARLPDGSPWPIRAPDPWERPRYGKWG